MSFILGHDPISRICGNGKIWVMLFQQSYGLFGQWQVMFRNYESDPYWGYHANMTLSYWGFKKVNLHIMNRADVVPGSTQSWRVVDSEKAYLQAEENREYLITDNSQRWVKDGYTAWDEEFDWAWNESDAATYAMEDLGGLFENMSGETGIAMDLTENPEIIACLVALLFL